MGRVRVARLLRAPTPQTLFTTTTILIFLFVVLSCSVVISSAAPDSAVDALMRFRNSLSDSKSLANWDPQTAPCNGNRANWVGVLCFHGNVRGLQLENMGLKGIADVASLALMPHFRTLSFMNNTLIGPIPDLKKLSRLRSVYLSYNHFSGEIPDDCFSGMRFLKKVLLSNNEFEGKIPSSLVGLAKLVVLRLDGNKFEGRIPSFGQQSLKRINVSNNALEGSIPDTLNKMDSSAFSGNKNLCGPPLESCSSLTINIYPNNDKKSTSEIKIVLIGLIIALIVAILAAAFIIARSRRRNSQLDRSLTLNDRHFNTFTTSYGLMNNQPSEPEATPNPRRATEGKLSFLRDDRQRFDLHDLLRASAEILGSGTFGSSYKANILCDALVVKRYRQMNSLGREEFHEHMRRLGRLNHPNLLPLVAYYYRREEKLLVYDYVENGSLAFHLHGNRSMDQPALDWPTRLRIIKGVAKGLTYLYNALPSLVVPHGHLKSSNIVVTDAFEPLMTDYGLLPAINLDHAQHLMMAYKSPEHAKLGRITKKTDVWSLGIIILEILTGKFPENYLTQRYDPNADLAGWVNEMIKEKKTGQVFDAEMGGVKNSKGEMLKLLMVGVSCCEEDVDRRLDLSEAVEKIDKLSHDERENIVNNHNNNNIVDGEFFHGINVNGEEEDGYISRAML
ncbi:Probably inactive leucine-rich repeat receptor-like protein kinase [Morus notabilis]|uniref:non-specific serine/threonine protein kinase n=2 Tax=Morus notabilis TaxID=981085 RepID=W9SZ15_9ROSA|nr:Probably inactive leucine-rich repeat receptor-like protein kinase [Morus notabilis]